MSRYLTSRPLSLQNNKLPLGSGCRHMQQTTFGRLDVAQHTGISFPANTLCILSRSLIANDDDDIKLKPLDAMHGCQSHTGP